MGWHLRWGPRVCVLGIAGGSEEGERVGSMNVSECSWVVGLVFRKGGLRSKVGWHCSGGRQGRCAGWGRVCRKRAGSGVTGEQKGLGVGLSRLDLGRGLGICWFLGDCWCLCSWEPALPKNPPGTSAFPPPSFHLPSIPTHTPGPPPSSGPQLSSACASLPAPKKWQ